MVVVRTIVMHRATVRNHKDVRPRFDIPHIGNARVLTPHPPALFPGIAMTIVVAANVRVTAAAAVNANAALRGSTVQRVNIRDPLTDAMAKMITTMLVGICGISGTRNEGTFQHYIYKHSSRAHDASRQPSPDQSCQHADRIAADADLRHMLARHTVKERVILLPPRDHRHPTIHRESPKHRRPRNRVVARLMFLAFFASTLQRRTILSSKRLLTMSG
jgi:hypothetical protein